jgi:hypothetical protein
MTVLEIINGMGTRVEGNCVSLINKLFLKIVKTKGTKYN